MKPRIRYAGRKGHGEKRKAVKTVKFSVTRVKRYGHKVDRSLDLFFKSLKLLPLLFFLFACSKKEDAKAASAPTPTTLPVTTVRAHLTVLLMGQSNMADFQNKAVFLDTIRGDLSGKVAKIDFVPCAVGGTLISYQISTLVPACLNYSESQDAGLVLYYQGESDAMAANSHWNQDFLTVVRMIRCKHTNIPIIFAQIGDVGNPPVPYPYWPDFQALQWDIALDNYMDRITGKGLPLDAGGYVDLGPDAAVELAHRWSSAMLHFL